MFSTLSPFPIFSTLPITNFNFTPPFILSSANPFNLDQSKILSFGKEVTRMLTNSNCFRLHKYTSNWLTFFHTIPTIDDPEKRQLLKTLWEKEKMLVTKDIFQFLSRLFVVCKCFQFRGPKISSCGKGLNGIKRGFVDKNQ